MKKNWFTKIKAIVVVFFSIALSVSPFNPVKLVDTEDSGIVCAASDIGFDELGTGTACLRKDTCDRLDNRLMDRVLDWSIAIHPDDRNAFLSQFNTLLTREYCVTDNVTAISGFAINFKGIAGADSDFVWGFCTGDVGLTRIQGGNVSTKFTLCCPRNHNAVYRLNYTDGERVLADGYANFGCCPVLPNYGAPESFESDTPYPGNTFYCNYKDLKKVETSSFILANGANSTLTGFRAGVFETSGSPSVTNDIENAIVNCKNDPSMSYDIEGTSGISCRAGYIYKDTTNTSSEFKCPNLNGCALVDDTYRLASYLNTEDSKGKACVRCFNPGEPISVGTDGNMMVCEPLAATTDKVAPVPLCNGSVIDTISCLGGSNATSQNAASEGINSVNYGLCCDCRAQGGVWTGIGCTDTTPSGLITGLIRIIYGVMGGVALIMLIYAGIMYQTGNEANVKKARELIIQTVSGLVVLTFSILILRIIGINILDILPAGSI